MLLSDIKLDDLEIIKDGEYERPFLMYRKALRNKLVVMTLNKVYFENACKDEHISSIITTREVIRGMDISMIDKGIAVTDYPEYVLYSINNYLFENNPLYFERDGKKTLIGDNCEINDKAVIAPQNVKIGDRCVLEENVIVREGVTIGDDVVIRAGAIIGASENQTVIGPRNEKMFVKESGNVIIGKNCELGYYSIIQRGFLSGGETRIGNHVSIGSNVNVGHDASISDYVDIKCNCVINGYVNIDAFSHIDPMCAISKALSIGENVNMTLGSTVINNIVDNTSVAGNWAIDKKKFMFWHAKKVR